MKKIPFNLKSAHISTAQFNQTAQRFKQALIYNPHRYWYIGAEAAQFNRFYPSSR